MLAAGRPGSPTADEALATLCRTYWRPIYVYLRRRGADREKAEDLTQGFFATLLEKNYLGDADRERGRFRTFLLTAVQNYARNEWDRARAGKRGGGIPIDPLEGEESFHQEPSHEETPERLFDRRWARTLLQVALDRLQEEMEQAGASERFARLLPFLTGEGDESYRDAAAGLGMSEPAARVQVHRMRRRFQRLLREEVAETVGDTALVDDELRHLHAVLGA